MKTNTAFPAILIALLAIVWPAISHAQIIANATGGFNEYTLSGKALATPLISSTNAFGAIAVSGSNLFIVIGGDGSPGSSSIGEYTTAGTAVNESLVTGLDYPYSIAVSDDGTTLFVADIADSTVSSYDSTTGDPIQVPLISNLPGPECVAVSGSNLFVLNSNYLDSSGTTGSIGLYTTDGGVVNASLVTGLDGPASLALSGSDIFVACAGIPGPNYNYSYEGIVGEYRVSGTTGITVKASLIHGLTTPQVIAVSGTDIFVSDNLGLDEYTFAGLPWDPTNGPIFLPDAGTNAIVILPLAMLPAATLQVTGTNVPGGPLYFTVLESVTGVTVTIQYSLDDVNWTNLSGAGNLAGSGGVYTTGTGGSSTYPAGQSVYFRAVCLATGYTETLSNALGAYTLEQAQEVSFSLVPDVTQVAPGGFINYSGTIKNLASFTVHNAVVAIPVPPFTRFVPYDPGTKLGTTFLNSKGHAQYPFPGHALELVNTPRGPKNMPVENPLRFNGALPTEDLPPEVQEFLNNNPLIVAPADDADEAVFYVGTMQEHGSQGVRLTVQAQYAYPDTAPDQEIDNSNYLAYTEDISGNMVGTLNGSDIVTPFAGNVINAPSLSLSKELSATTRSPGEPFLVVLIASNHGLTAADDVFITDSLPPGSPLMTPNYQETVSSDAPEALLKASVVFLGKSSSIKTSEANYFVSLDSNNVLHIGGLHLEPGASMAIGYVAEVPSNASVPETLLSGNSSIGAEGGNQTIVGTGTNQTSDTMPSGIPAEIPIQVIANDQLLAFPPTPLVSSLFVSNNAITTGSALDKIYKANENAAPYVPGSSPAQFIPGVQSYLLQYAVTGSSAATDVHLQFATPANTVFYRAAFMAPSGNGKIAAPSKGQSIFQPAHLVTGTTTFNFGNLNAGDSGEVMVEVICTGSAVQLAGSPSPTGTPVIFSGTSPAVSAPSASSGAIVYDGANVPAIGLMKVAPQSVVQGQDFTEQFVIMNSGTVALSGSCLVQMQAPAGVQIVNVATTQGIVQDQTSTDFSVQFTPASLGPRQAAGLTVTLTATGAANTSIVEDSIVADIPYAGMLDPGAVTIQIIPAASVVSNATTTVVSGVQYATVGELTIIPIGHDAQDNGYAVVSGPAQFIGNYAATTKAFTAAPVANGNEIASGVASDIPLLNLPVVNNTDANSSLLQLADIIKNEGGNIINGPGGNLVTPDGTSLINNNTGAVLVTLMAMSPVGLLPSDIGYVGLTGSANAALVFGGNIFVQGAGFLMTAHGGTVSRDAGKLTSLYGALLTAEAGGLLDQTGADIVSYDGLSLISSPLSNTVIQTPAGNIITSGSP